MERGAERRRNTNIAWTKQVDGKRMDGWMRERSDE